MVSLDQLQSLLYLANYWYIMILKLYAIFVAGSFCTVGSSEKVNCQTTGLS